MQQDGIYHAVFDSTSMLGQFLLVLRNGRVAGAGHALGEYEGTYRIDAARGELAFEISVKVPSGVQIATGVKAGPAGSTVTFKGQGPVPNPQERFSVDLLGVRTELTLEYLEPMPG
jgi:hypothetical protein